MDTEDFRLYDLDKIYMPDDLKLFYENGKPVPFTGVKHPNSMSVSDIGIIYYVNITKRKDAIFSK